MGTEDQTPTETEAQTADSGPEKTTTEEQDTFPRAYVEKVRQEAAEHRKKAAQVDTMREALHAAYLRLGTQGILHDPEALPWSDDYADPETGLPDADRIRSAAEALADEQPWLSRPRGDVGQGFRGETSDAVNLAGMLRAGA